MERSVKFATKRPENVYAKKATPEQRVPIVSQDFTVNFHRLIAYNVIVLSWAAYRMCAMHLENVHVSRTLPANNVINAVLATTTTQNACVSLYLNYDFFSLNRNMKVSLVCSLQLRFAWLKWYFM